MWKPELYQFGLGCQSELCPVWHGSTWWGEEAREQEHQKTTENRTKFTFNAVLHWNWCVKDITWSQPLQICPRRKPLFSKRHKTARLVFVRQKPDGYWQHILWSAVAKIHLEQNETSMWQDRTAVTAYSTNERLLVIVIVQVLNQLQVLLQILYSYWNTK